ncbi:MAG: hypothetical protein QM775_17675 [Pirellulales bacterium]
MALGRQKRRPVTILVYVYSNGFAGYAVAPRIEGDARPHEMNLTGTTLPLHAVFEIAGDYLPLVPEQQMKLDRLEEAIFSLKERGFDVAKLPEDE